jgi:cytochrome c-type protein NapC
MLKKTRARLARYSPVTLLVVGVIGGILFWGGFNTAMEATNTETFCISCHEMEVNVYREYRNTNHYNNRTGVRATCPDCHVPKDWVHKFVRKVKATNELYHKAVGSIDTPEKFDAKRLQLAQNVWRSMKATDSRECRNCHDNISMDFTKQGRRAVEQHQRGIDEGLTCIDCHKGIAHSLPDMSGVDASSVVAVQE